MSEKQSNNGGSVIGLSLVGFAIYQLLLKPLYFEPKKSASKINMPESVYAEIEHEMIAHNRLSAASGYGFLSSNDDLSNSQNQKRWLEMFKDFCVQKDWDRDKCLKQLNAFNKERNTRLQAERDQESREQKRTVAKEKELGF